VYFSKKLSGATLNYLTYNKELYVCKSTWDITTLLVAKRVHNPFKLWVI
jgi:hypothetical protein